MRPEEIQKLLGGYATGTLTPAEQQALFEAALRDQELFDALAKDQPLHDLLRDPAARAHLLAAIDERPKPWYRRRPMWAGGLALAAAACLAAAAGIYITNRKAAEKPVLVADVTKQPAQPEPAPPAVVEPPKEEPARPYVPAEKKKSVAKDAEAAKPAAADVALGRVDAAGRGEKKAEPALNGGLAGGVIGGVPPATAQNQQLQALDKIEPPKPAAAPPPAAVSAPKGAAFSANGAPVDAAAAEPKPAVTAVSGFFDPNAQQNAKELFYAGGPSQSVNLSQAEQARLRQQLATSRRASLEGVPQSVPNPGVKWTALRKQPDGLFREVDPEQIHAGDVIKLRLVPNDNGYVSMAEGTRRLIADAPVQRLIPFETPEITSATAGSKELTVVLARQPRARMGIVRVAADQQSVFVRDEKSNYTVNPNAPSLPVAVKIRLQYK